jgi:hypothetical protein
MTDDLKISKTMAVVMAVVAVVTAVISVNIGIAIGNSINNNRRSTPASSMQKFAPHPHLAERRLTAIEDPQKMLEHLREKLAGNPGVEAMAKNIPTTVAELKDQSNVATALPEVRAASWLIHENKVNAEEFLLSRYALAHIYYNNGGLSWNNTQNWLSPTESHCTWYGITCCKNFLFSPVCANITADPDGVTELDLYNNNLIGTIPKSIALLTDVQSIFLSENWLTGSIPSENVFQPLKKLLKLYLQHNTLTGSVPDIWNGVLGTFLMKTSNKRNNILIVICLLFMFRF